MKWSEIKISCRLCGADALHKKKELCTSCQNLKATMKAKYKIALRLMEEIEEEIR